MGPFYPLEKRVDETPIVSFYRNKKNDEQIHFSETNKEFLKDPQLKKLLNFAIDKKLSNYTFSYQGEIIPVTPILTKNEGKRYVDVEAEVHSEPKNELQGYMPEETPAEQSKKVIYPAVWEYDPLEMESKFHKNFKTLNLSKNVAVVSKPQSPERQVKLFALGSKPRTKIFKGKRSNKGSKQESIKIIMDKEQSKSLLGIWEFENENERDLSLEMQLENLPISEKVLKRLDTLTSLLRGEGAKPSSFCRGSSKLFKKKRVKFHQ